MSRKKPQPIKSDYELFVAELEKQEMEKTLSILISRFQTDNHGNLCYAYKTLRERLLKDLNQIHYRS